MENELLLHPKTERALRQSLASNIQGLLLTGPAGSGKASLATQLAASRHTQQANDLLLVPAASIETIRSIEHFLTLRTIRNGKRTIIVEDAHQLSIEAQNALLKILEEPPANTLFILTSESTVDMLPTVRSRVTTVPVLAPASDKLSMHFTNAGFDNAAVKRAELISGGLPGRMQALLTAENDDPLLQAAALARDCIQKTGFERLCMVDSLVKDRQLSLNTLAMLQQMAKLSLATGKTNRVWPIVLQAAYEASQQLQHNAQPKLVLTDLMLKLSV